MAKNRDRRRQLNLFDYGNYVEELNDWGNCVLSEVSSGSNAVHNTTNDLRNTSCNSSGQDWSTINHGRSRSQREMRQQRRMNGNHGCSRVVDTQTPQTFENSDKEPDDLHLLYPLDEIQDGYVVTDRIESGPYSHYLMTTGRKIFNIPSWLSKPLNSTNTSMNSKWKKLFDPVYGEALSFVCTDPRKPNEVRNYRKNHKQMTKVKTVGNSKGIKVACVFSPCKEKYLTDLFGEMTLDPKYGEYDGNVVYDGLLTFKIVKDTVIAELAEVTDVAENQELVHITSWNKEINPSCHNHEESSMLDREKGNYEMFESKMAFRSGRREMILVNNSDNMESLRIPFELNKLTPLGSVCVIDYVEHAIENRFIVKSPRMIQTFETYHVDGDYRYVISDFSVDRIWKGFYFHKNLGPIADSQGLLGFLPYSPNRSKTIKVVIKRVQGQLCPFDISTLSEETMTIVKNAVPNSLKTSGLLVNGHTGQVVSAEYPGLKLYLHPCLRKKYRPGSSIETTYYPNEDGNKLISGDDESFIRRDEAKSEQWLPIAGDYCLFLFRNVGKVTVTEEVLKKNQKQEVNQELLANHDYETYFKDYLTVANNILSSFHPNDIRRKFKTDMKDSCSVVVKPNLDEGGQSPFKFVCVFDMKADKFTQGNSEITEHLRKRYELVNVEKLVKLDGCESVQNAPVCIPPQIERSPTPESPSEIKSSLSQIPVKYSEDLSSVSRTSSPTGCESDFDILVSNVQVDENNPVVTAIQQQFVRLQNGEHLESTFYDVLKDIGYEKFC